ncbi:MAG: hypothetical protein R6V85_02875 [Polyangia bacterium]
MSTDITASDLWPLVQKLTRQERIRLARLVLVSASRTGGSDAKAYEGAPPTPDEFRCAEDALAWEAEGWEEFDAKG